MTLSCSLPTETNDPTKFTLSFTLLTWPHVPSLFSWNSLVSHYNHSFAYIPISHFIMPWLNLPLPTHTCAWPGRRKQTTVTDLTLNWRWQPSGGPMMLTVPHQSIHSPTLKSAYSTAFPLCSNLQSSSHIPTLRWWPCFLLHWKNWIN